VPRLRWVFAAGIAVLMIFIAGTAYFFEIRKLARLRAAVEERSLQLAEKERGVRKYREKIEFYKTEEGIAHLAREEYNLTFPGERVFLVVSVSADDAAP
jgi:cell division protein FtsB